MAYFLHHFQIIKFSNSFMKPLLLFLMLLPLVATAQKIALIDRGFKKPVQFTDSATMDHMFENFFPVYVRDIGAILKKTEWLIAQIDTGSKQPSIDNEISVGNSTFVYASSGMQNNARHQLVLATRTSGLSTSVKLFEFNDSRKRSIQRLLIFSDYVRNNLAGAGEGIVVK
jgi:hypothetical protein